MIYALTKCKFLIVSISFYLFILNSLMCHDLQFEKYWTRYEEGPFGLKLHLIPGGLQECHLHFEICFEKNICCSQACCSELGLIGMMTSKCIQCFNIVIWGILYFLRPWDDLAIRSQELSNALRQFGFLIANTFWTQCIAGVLVFFPTCNIPKA